MLKHLYLILLSTFIFGLICGGILFLYNNTTGKASDTSKETILSTEMTVYQYGGCARAGNCASYHISDTGAYVYIVRGRNTDDVRHEGMLSASDKKALYNGLAKMDMQKVIQSIFSGTCPVTYDGIAYRYEIVKDGISYSFDSCTQQTNAYSFFETLDGFFEILSNQV